jgi:protein required for attachment to host cells
MLHEHAVDRGVKTCWVLVANGGRARIIEMSRKPGDFRELQYLESPSMHLTNQDLVSDASGRSFHVRGPAGHSKPARSDAHDLGEQQFARSLVQRLERALAAGRFDGLVIAADPRTLGTLRKSLSRELAACLTLEMNLDLTGMPARKLEDKLRSALRPGR